MNSFMTGTSSCVMNRLIKHLEKLAPLHLADKSWDNVGLLVEAPFPRDSFNKVMLTIDLTPNVVDEALNDGNVGAIMAYHPVIFKPLHKLSMTDSKEASILKCIARGISIYCPHTSLDACNPGINDWLLEPFQDGGNSLAVPILPTTTTTNIKTSTGVTGMGRFLSLKQQDGKEWNFDGIVKAIKKHVLLDRIRVAKSPYAKSSMIESIAVCAGSGGSVLSSIQASVYVTGEMSHHEILTAIGRGIHVILCEHSNSERGYLQHYLQPKLQSLFDGEGDGNVDIQVVTSKQDKDPIEIL